MQMEVYKRPENSFSFIFTLKCKCAYCIFINQCMINILCLPFLSEATIDDTFNTQLQQLIDGSLTTCMDDMKNNIFPYKVRIKMAPQTQTFNVTIKMDKEGIECGQEQVRLK